VSYLFLYIFIYIYIYRPFVAKARFDHDYSLLRPSYLPVVRPTSHGLLDMYPLALQDAQCLHSVTKGKQHACLCLAKRASCWTSCATIIAISQLSKKASYGRLRNNASVAFCTSCPSALCHPMLYSSKLLPQRTWKYWLGCIWNISLWLFLGSSLFP